MTKPGARTAFRYVLLAFYLAIMDLKADASKTLAGFLWWIIEPIIYMGIYYALFSIILGIRTENFALFLLVGLLPWRWLQVSVLQAGTSITRNRSLFRQAYIPKFVFPLQTIISNGVKFLIAATVLFIFLVATGNLSLVGTLYFPILIAVQFFLIMSLSFIFSAIVPFVPDFYNLTTFLFRGLFYISGVLFDISRIPKEYQDYLYLNPLSSLIKAYRETLLLGHPPDYLTLTAIFSLSIVGMAFGLFLQARFDNAFIKSQR